MPKIILPEMVKCHECDGRGKIIVSGLGPNEPGSPAYTKDCPFCEDGYRWDLGNLYRAVQEAGGLPSVIFAPSEGEPDYVAEILFPENRYAARGDTYELAAVAVINKANEEAESGQNNG